MKTFLMIYGLMILMAVLCALSEKIIRKREIKFAPACAAFFAAFYFVVVSFRSVMSSGAVYLSTSFKGKTASGYIKVTVLLLVMYLAYTFVLYRIKDIIRNIVGVFAILMCIKIVCFSYPNMMTTMIIGIVSILLGVVWYLMRDTRFIKYLVKESDQPSKLYTIAIRLCLFSMFFLIEGPIELFAYNQEFFDFGFKSLLPALVMGTIILIAAGSFLISEYVPGIMFDAVSIIVFGYTVLNYIQSMFLNGTMDAIDGVFQEWSFGQKAINLVVWIVLAVIVVVLETALKNGRKVMNTTALLLSLLLLWSTVSVILTSGVISSQRRELVTDDMLTVSGKEDVIVIILDAYDTQMMDVVLEDVPDYISPLHDFTYYDNMETQYVYTDGEVPYLFTGVKEELGERSNKEYIESLYSKGSLWDLINSDDCDIKVLTDRKYVAPVDDGIISNYTTDVYCVMDIDRIVGEMADSIRYKGVMFLFKPQYSYASYVFADCIEDSNIYMFGKDYNFEESLLSEGLTTCDYDKTFRFYHLYGAHAAYYLSEYATLDYSATPLAQWKGCLKIVYDYLDALKAIDAYDESTIIIMADHGLNNTNRIGAAEFGYEFTDDSNPIFFIKRKNESHDELIIDHKETSHDVFVPTIVKSFDETATSVGNAIWE